MPRVMLVNQETGEMLINLDHHSAEIMLKYADGRIGIDELIVECLRSKARETSPRVTFLKIEIIP